MSVFIRPATVGDIRQMAALAGPGVTARSLADWMDGDSAYAAWHLVEDEAGSVLGFQHVGRMETLPEEACEIATFFGTEPLPAGAAARLFDATADAARLLRYTWISAAVARTNDAARTFYQSRGFRVWDETPAQVKLRFDLD